MAQISLDSDFENGNLGFYNVSNDTITLPSSSFLHFRMTGMSDEEYHFSIDQGENGFSHRYNHRMVYRYAGESIWRQVDTAYVDDNNWYHFYNHTAFTNDTIYMAYWYPFTYSDVEDYLSEIEANPYVVDLGVRDTSYFGRNIYGYVITDTSVPDDLKQKVIIQNRQHAMESPGSLVAQGLSKYLLYSTDSISIKLKQRAKFYFYPMMNPDGVVEGGNPIGGPDHNDEWFASCSAQGGMPSANFEIEKMRNIIWDDCDGHANFAFDIHSHPGHTGKYYWWSLVDTNSTFGITQDMCDNSLLLISRINHHDAEDNGEAIISSSSNDFVGWSSNLTAPPADWWLNQTMGAISYTLEPGSAPTRAYDRIEQVGVSIAKGLLDVLPPVDISNQIEYSELSIQIYPNPIQDHLQIKAAGIESVAIISMNGHKVMGHYQAHNEMVNLRLNHLPNGFYLLQILMDGNFFVEKIVIQR